VNYKLRDWCSAASALGEPSGDPLEDGEISRVEDQLPVTCPNWKI